MISRAASLATKILGQRQQQVWRVDGDSPVGVRCWSYVLVDKNKFNAFKRALSVGNIQVQDYGEVLAWGEGDAPPKHVRNCLRDLYGYDVIED